MHETKKRSRWDVAPPTSQLEESQPNVKYQKTSWDQVIEQQDGTVSKPTEWSQMETPIIVNNNNSATMQTPIVQSNSKWDQTPIITSSSSSSSVPIFDMNMDPRNKPLSDEELDSLLPQSGYRILIPPKNYIPKKNELFEQQQQLYYSMPSSVQQQELLQQVPQVPSGYNMPAIKPEDMKYFGKLLEMSEEEEDAVLNTEERKERKIMRLLLKVKSGTPPLRKQALRILTEKARDFGAAPLFNQILPILMSPSLEDQERHLMVKLINRILFKLDDLVRPFVHKILHVISPLLIEEEYYARMEAKEIISNLSKAAGLTTMITTMRPDLDHPEEYIRNVTARAFAIVSTSLGIPNVILFLKAVCQSKKSWQARHTGIKIIQQIAILMGIGILPYLKQCIDCIEHGLKDQEVRVRTISALAVAALAEASAPYGIESFDLVLGPLWFGIHSKQQQNRGKALVAFLKAIGNLIPLMSVEHATQYAKNVMDVVIREFASQDDEMKKTVSKVVKQCLKSHALDKQFVIQHLLDPFFKYFWVRKMALEKRNYKHVLELAVELSQCVGISVMLERMVQDLKDESEPFRKLVMETIQKMLISSSPLLLVLVNRLEEELIDGCMYALQESQSTATEDTIILNGFATVCNALGGTRMKPFMKQIIAMILIRLSNKSAKVRQQASDCISKLALIIQQSGNEHILCNQLGPILYENLGEEFPDVLASIIGALLAICKVIPLDQQHKMKPSIKDLLPRMTPILKNRHEKVQEHSIQLVGYIAQNSYDQVSAKEWMRICFELLEMLKAHKKSIRRFAIQTFGYIARAIGPQDVLTALLNNLKVQERQLRVCTTVAIAIVAETCAPFTVLPALMNEYRVPELNVQNGVLKSLSYLFEYIGEMSKDYMYAIVPLLEDALTDRDLVHRQTACTVVKHLALGCVGHECEDALYHLLNLIWPNIFETSPHVINAVMESLEALRVALGPSALLQYCLQGLFHPARKVRAIYWKIYNNIYIGAADAMIPTFPKLAQQQYVRNELELFL